MANITVQEHDYLLRIVLVGDSSVGKTSLLARYTNDVFNDAFIPTTGVDFKIRSKVIDGFRIKLQLWDTEGRSRFRHNFPRGADGLAVAYDVTNMESFEHVTQWLQEQEAGNYHNNPKLLVGNKIDLDLKRVVTQKQGKQLAHRMELTYVETSAKTSENVHAALDNLTDTIVRSYRAAGILLEAAKPIGSLD